MISAKIIADSISGGGTRITTMELCYPKYIHGEVMTHRVFSRNARSSRAVPVKKILHEVATSPVEPIEWLSNKAGMQGGEPLVGSDLEETKIAWHNLARIVSQGCERMGHKLHKQWANRPLEPFSNIYTVVTSTYWNNFYQLRRHPDAQPEIRTLADKMHAAHLDSRPITLKPGEWHLPYVSIEGDPQGWRKDEILRKVSAARCARVSYKTFENKIPTLEDDLNLFERLMGSQPFHASPAEHQATPDEYEYRLSGNLIWARPDLHGNFYGWIQFRKTLSGEDGNVDCGILGVM